MDSLWSKTVELPNFKPLEKDMQTDILIIGGGMAGLLCAHMLKQTGVNYALIEANQICSGITKNTTAKITSQHGLIYHKILERYGLEKAQMYYRANEQAVREYRRICQKIECDYRERDSYVYSTYDRVACKNEIKALEKMGYQMELVEKLPLPFYTVGAVRFPNQAEFHPLKFASEISKDLNIHEQTRAMEILQQTGGKGYLVKAKHGENTTVKITAEKIIVTTHFPFLNMHGSYFLKMYQHRSYVIALEHAPQVNGMYVDDAEKGMSFRNYENLLLIGGGDHRTGKQGGNWTELETFARENYPKANVKYRWATQDCMTLDGIPYIGQYSKNTPDLYVATGFNKWGMTSSMTASKLLTDMILGKYNEYAPVFNPSRSMLHPQLAVNALEAIANLLTISNKRCPHMGCALKWNSQEHSWDCPCHGSRFESTGKLIDNPATGDLKK